MRRRAVKSTRFEVDLTHLRWAMASSYVVLVPERQINDLLACLRRLEDVEQIGELISLTVAPNLSA